MKAESNCLPGKMIPVGDEGQGDGDQEGQGGREDRQDEGVAEPFEVDRIGEDLDHVGQVKEPSAAVNPP